MNVAYSLDAIQPDVHSVVTVGTFDGVHRGHREILRRVVQEARNGGRSVVVTFDPHPKSVVGRMAGQAVPLLTTVEERRELLEGEGIDLMLVIRFTREFSQLTAAEFIERYLVQGIGLRHIVVGHDHHFGRDRQGSAEELGRLGALFGFSIERIPAFVLDGEIVSSSAVRAALEAGNILKANDQLGYRYMMEGEVVQGDHRGKTLGFPTANIAVQEGVKLVPARGVYVVEAETEGIRRYGMMNIGVRPTVAGGLQETREVHLFDFNGDLYGSRLRVHFVARLRGERKFPSLAALVEQLGSDREASRQIIAGIQSQSQPLQ